MLVEYQNVAVEYNEDREQIDNYIIRNFAHSVLGMCLIHRMINNRDAKILITSKGNTTGLGKTTFATMLARAITRVNRQLFNEPSIQFDAKEHAFIDGWEYVNYYRNEAKTGQVMLADEIQIAMDSRRSQTSRQVEFSQKWEKLRYKNCITIGTLPGLHRVDLRVREDADFWINITQQGTANVYAIPTNDFTGMIEYKRLRKYGQKEQFLFNALPDDDTDMEYIDTLKEKRDINENQDSDEAGDMKELLEDHRTQQLITILDYIEREDIRLTQNQIADMIVKDPSGETMSQQWVSNMKNEVYLPMRENGDIPTSTSTD